MPLVAGAIAFILSARIRLNWIPVQRVSDRPVCELMSVNLTILGNSKVSMVIDLLSIAVG